MRAGHVTQAAMNGVSERDIMRQTGHKSAEMLAKYIRIGEMFTRNAAAGLGIWPLRKRAYQSFSASVLLPASLPSNPNHTTAPKPIRRTP